jgi:hypothetical protein
VTVLPWTPCHPLLHTFFWSLIVLLFGLRHLSETAQPVAMTEAQLFGG